MASHDLPLSPTATRFLDMLVAGEMGAISVYMGGGQSEWTFWSALAMGAIAGAVLFAGTAGVRWALRKAAKGPAAQ